MFFDFHDIKDFSRALSIRPLLFEETKLGDWEVENL